MIDGDTIEVAGNRIRLEGIDAPERGQECRDRLRQPYDCGATAVRTLVDLIKSQTVSCEPVRLDKYRRTLAICRLSSGLDLNAEMVRQGRAAAFRRYSDRYVVEENEARRTGVGVWSGVFEHPGCWRAQMRGTECKEVLSTN